MYLVTERWYARADEITNSSTSGNGSGGNAYIVGIEEIGREIAYLEGEEGGEEDEECDEA